MINKYMSALYRKYSPKTFNDVLGQNIAIRVLKSLVENSSDHHSILFSGIHGIGKTLLARIFAKAINCLSNTNSIGPCLKCENCLLIDSKCPDLIEIDAATYTGVENIRKVIDDTRYLPSSLKYKIYIIDEVHRLSKSAFDSLLKTLEEPPAYIKFIFATTERQNVPDTILSRCLSLPLQRISKNLLFNYIQKICEEEGVNFSHNVLNLIIEESDGSVRESLSILQMIILSKCDNEEEILKYLKIFSKTQVFDILQLIFQGQLTKAIEIWQQMQYDGYSEKDFLHKLSEIITNIFLTKTENYHKEDKQLFVDFIEKYNIQYSILIHYWEILITQTESLYSGNEFTVEFTLGMMSLVEDKTNLLEEAKNLFPGLKTIS